MPSKSKGPLSLSLMTICQSADLKSAMMAITANKTGHVFLVNASQQVIGCLTDGDVRSWLLGGNGLDVGVLAIAKKEFVWEFENCARQKLLKHFDLGIRLVPLLSEDRKLTSIVDQSSLPKPNKQKLSFSSKAPVRLGLAGGGSDLSYVFMSHGGMILNAAIHKFVNVRLFVRDDEKIFIRSSDLQKSRSYSNLNELVQTVDDFSLLRAAIQYVDPGFGFDLDVDCDFPIGSGLGGSSAVVVAILGCFNEAQRNNWNKLDIVNAAFEVERLLLGVKGGWQDMYASVYGGINVLEFTDEDSKRYPLRLDQDDLVDFESRLIVCDTGISHSSGQIHEAQEKHLGDENRLELIKNSVSNCKLAVQCLLDGDYKNFGKIMSSTWMLKKQFSPKASSLDLDKIYDRAMEAGASGGKLLGAGGGGYYLFFVEPDKKIDVMNTLKGMKLAPQSVEICHSGLIVYSR